MSDPAGAARILLEHLASAAADLWSNRMRSVLTTTGIVIGVATVTGVASLVQGLNRQVTDALGGIGAGTVYIQKMPAVMAGDSREYRRRADFSASDARGLEGVPGVIASVPQAEWFVSVKAPDGVELAAALLGTTHDWPVVAHRDLSGGRFFTEFEAASGRSVCVVGASVSERLFGDSDPSGMTIEAEGRRLLVLGVLESSGEIMGQTQDNFIVVPLGIFGAWAEPGPRMSIAVEAEPGSDMDAFVGRIEAAMRRLRGLGLDDDNDFELVTAEQLLDTYRNISTGIYAAMLAISAIALLVGSVGIANIMLVSVTERTREIGLRKAMGATDRQILVQFLTESVILALVGGAMGVGAGSLLALLVSSISPIPAGLEAWSVFLAVGASALVGILAGVFPALRAARLEPVRALGHGQ